MTEGADTESKYAQVDDERVRDHLANERTYLAWLRTGVAMIGLGVVIEKLRHMSTEAVLSTMELGLIFSSIGVITIVLSLFFFVQTRKEIRSRSYSSKMHFAIALALVMVTLGVLIIWLLTQVRLAQSNSLF